MAAMKAQIFILCLAISTAMSNFVIPRRNMCTGRRNGVQLANTLDCAAYFVCNHGLPEIFRCSGSLLYDDKVHVCNWPENVACGQITNEPSMVKPVLPAPDVSLHSVHNGPKENTFIHHSATKPVAPQQKPAETVHHPVHPLTKPQFENLPDYLHVEGIPEVQGEMELVAPEGPLPTPPNPQSANTHLTAVRPPRPQFQQNAPPKIPETQGIPEVETLPEMPRPNQQPQAIAAATQEYSDIAQSLPPAFMSDMIEYYVGIQYDKYSMTDFRCTIDHFYFAPHPKSCQKYFICVNRRAYQHQCGDGVYWDYINNQCDFARKSICYKDLHDVAYEMEHMEEESQELPPDYFGNQIDPLFNGIDAGFNGPAPDFPDLDGVDAGFNGFVPFSGEWKEPTYDQKPHFGNDNNAFGPHQPQINEHLFEQSADSFEHSADGFDQGSEVYEQGTDEFGSGGLPGGPPVFESTENQGWDMLPNWNSKEGFIDMPKDSWNSGWNEDVTWQGAAIPVQSETNQASDENSNKSVEDDDWVPECPEKEQAFYPYQQDSRKYFICISGMPILTSCPENMSWDIAHSQCR